MKTTETSREPVTTQTCEPKKELNWARRHPKLLASIGGVAAIGLLSAKTNIFGVSVGVRSEAQIRAIATQRYDQQVSRLDARDRVAEQLGSSYNYTETWPFALRVSRVSSGKGLKGLLTAITDGGTNNYSIPAGCLDGSPYDVYAAHGPATVVADETNPDSLSVVGTNPGTQPLQLKGLSGDWLVPANAYTTAQLKAYGCEVTSTLSLSDAIPN